MSFATVNNLGKQIFCAVNRCGCCASRVKVPAVDNTAGQQTRLGCLFPLVEAASRWKPIGESEDMQGQHSAVRQIACDETIGWGARGLARLVMLSAALAGLALLLAGGQALAATYYVCNDSSCPKASDTNSGETEEFPWKTVEHVNEKSLKPGDSVLLKGGDTFKEHGLWPSSSGSEGKPIVYSSYGTGHAILKLGVWLPTNRNWITIENFTVDGSEHGGAVYGGMQGVAGSGEGHNEHISVLKNTLEHLGIGVNGGAPEAAFSSDNHWLISENRINETGDSGIYVQGEVFTIEKNTIEHTGLDNNVHVKEHGIYLRGVNSSVLFNTISYFADAGVSVRYRNSHLEGNTISHGLIGVAWIPYDTVAGTSTWSKNTVSNVTEDAFFETSENGSVKTKESFVITNNTMSEAGGYMELNTTTGTYTVTGNTPCNVTNPPGNCTFKPKFKSTPYASTGSATNVTSTGAKLNGTLNPEAVETTYHFEYGTTTSYGTKVPIPDANVGSGESNQEVSRTITGLAASTTYHYRLVATNSIGNTEGEDHTFRTLGQITEYPLLSSNSEPHGITAGPDGNLWFADRGTSKIGKITTSGTVTEYSLPSGSEPWGITAGSDKNLWFTDNATSKIGRITTSGTITEYSLPGGSRPEGVAAGSDGNLWFTEASKIGKITTAGAVTEYPVASFTHPGAIAAGPDTNLWFAGGNKIGKITTSGTVTEYTGAPLSDLRGIVAGPDGNLWFTDYSNRTIGKITTSGAITEYSLSLLSRPQGITSGPDGNLWYTDYGASKIGTITTLGTITEYSLPSGSEPWGITAGPGKSLWFTDNATSKIGTITP
jgi:streptogramin lyase